MLYLFKKENKHISAGVEKFYIKQVYVSTSIFETTHIEKFFYLITGLA